MPADYEPLLVDFAEPCSPEGYDSMLLSLNGVHAIIAGGAMRYDGAFMDQIPTLRVIARTGIGVDNIVLEDATERGIAVCNTPDAPTTSTAELAITLMMATAKQLKKIEMTALQGKMGTPFINYGGIDMDKMRLGLVGMGRIAGRVARVALALGMSVSAFDPYVTPARAAELGIEAAPDLETLLRTSDIISLHVPATPDTRKLMNAERLALMKSGAILINTARGALVDEAALMAALDSGHLAGAGLDVFDPEPPDPNNPLLYRDNVICTPHIGGISVPGRDRLWRGALENAMQVLRGEYPASLVNPAVWDKRRV
jgi:D-3-phosphoglycerate dehydrogenase / 2-oxoglutarate reductase